MMLVMMLGAALAGTDADSTDGDIDCTAYSGADKTACETDVARLTEIATALTALNCDKGGKKKRESCNAEKAELELEKAELEVKHAEPPDDTPKTREVKLDFLGNEESIDGKPKDKKPDTTLEQDIADE